MKAAFLLVAVGILASPALAQQDYGTKCTVTQRSGCKVSSYKPKAMVAKPPLGQIQQQTFCTLIQSPAGPVPIGGQVTLTPSAACGSDGTYALDCYGASNCGAITTQGVYTPPPNVPIGITYGGTTITPVNNVWTLNLYGQPTDANSAAEIGWLQTLGGAVALTFYPAPGLIAEYQNVTSGLQCMIMHFYEGGSAWNGACFPYSLPPYEFCQSGCAQPSVSEPGGFSPDNHVTTILPLQYLQSTLYKPFLDFQKQTFAPCGTATCISLTTDFRLLPLPNPYSLWIWQSSCAALNSGDNGWKATVVQQPDSNGNGGILSVPVNTTNCPIGAAIASGINEGNESPAGHADNAQSGGMWSAASNLILGGPNAAQIQPVIADLAMAYDRFLQNLPDPNCPGGCVTALPYAFTTTLGNLEIAPNAVPPALVSAALGGGPCNVIYLHPCFPIASATESGTTVTMKLAENFNNFQDCSGNPIFSGPQQTCGYGDQMYWVFPSTGSGLEFPPASPWAQLNGKHILVTATDSGGTTFTFQAPANLGPLPSSGGLCDGALFCTWHDALPYGASLQLVNYDCKNLPTDASCDPTAKACTVAVEFCNTLANYGVKDSDGTDEPFAFQSDAANAQDTPPWMTTALGYLSFIKCRNSQGGGARLSIANCWRLVDITGALPNGPGDGTTNNGRVTVNYTATPGASLDVYPVGNVAGCLHGVQPIVAMPNNPQPSDCYVTGNVNQALTYTMRPVLADLGLDKNTGLITPPASRTTKEWTEVDACPAVLPPYGQCAHKWITIIPANKKGGANVWMGSQDTDYSGCGRYTAPDTPDTAGDMWWGTIVDPSCQHNWQTTCMIPQDDLYGELLGSYRAKCAGWASVPNAWLFGGVQGNNDQQVNIGLPNGPYNIYFRFEAGYNTTGPGQSMIRLLAGGSYTTPATVLADNVDQYVAAGGLNKPGILGPYLVQVTDHTLYFVVQSGGYSKVQFEGPNAGSLEIDSAGPPPPPSVNANPPPAMTGRPYNFQLVTGGVPPYTY